MFSQRAFRERKERHVRDLEAKLDLLTTTTSLLQADNERLRLMLRRAQSENEILRARTSSSPSSSQPSVIASHSSMLPPTHPLHIARNPTENHFHPARGIPHAQNSAVDTPGENRNLVPAAAVWDILQTHPIYLSGTLDINKVCELLKGKARCDGMGPMFNQNEVCGVIEEVGRQGGDAHQ